MSKKKVLQGRYTLDPTQKHLSPFYRLGGGNGTMGNFTVAESQQNLNNLVLHRLKIEPGITSS